MINNFEEGVLNALYDIRSEDFENCFFDDLSKNIDKIGVSKKIDKLNNFVEELLKKDNKMFEKYNAIMREIESAVLSEMDFKFRQYYKLGFCDSNILKSEIKEFVNITDNMNNISFYNEYFDSFSGYFEEYKFDYLRKKPEYKEIINEIGKLKEENPKLSKLVEDGDVEILNLDELKVLQKFLQLRDQEDFVEQKEVFRLGMKEMLNNLIEMNIIHLPKK